MEIAGENRKFSPLQNSLKEMQNPQKQKKKK